ncbi:MAG: bifunctional riboflavin kinase/FAD synthetase [Candidatus Izemoplasmatales bacterium]|uniref:Riboflavin biosynthesis protein n=1 Tax=Hujiaoplasma nucleasis TaxID=2725268 RepID=A0A7L6N031_9MOLU|nr:bifunctional riboflavin kinase/FAD synthetase [Hujiaoplasma nucleasis]QLY39606.1 bifunctional riboflavin kinase/FAD synthetase [Hujiaoplasma nucleasis]
MVLEIKYIDHHDQIEDLGHIAVLGFFDGLHIAHQALINKGLELKKKTGKKLFVFTFDQSIRKYLYNEPFYYLTSVDDKKEILETYQVDRLYVFKVSKEFISLSPENFINQYLIQMSYLVVGFDFTYGFRSVGNVSHLKAYKEFETIVMPEITYQDEKIGSSKIRQSLDEGEMDLANYLLGRNYQITGEVIHGRGVGKLLGFPTANIDFTNYYLPKRGVYLTKVIIKDKQYYGVTNVGKKPTFKDQSISLETYIFDLSKDLYGQIITIEFIEFMRDEIKYSHKEDLIKQIYKDVERSHEIIKRRNS